MFGRRVAVHSHGADGTLQALKLGVDSIEHGTMLSEEVIALWAKEQNLLRTHAVDGQRVQGKACGQLPMPMNPMFLAKIKWRIDITGKTLEVLVPRGIRIAFGTDAGVSKHGRNGDEFELMVAHGMTPETALVAATINAADLLGLS